MTARLVEHFGAPLPQSPERHAFPTPQRIAGVPFEEFAAKARMGYRNAYVYALSTAVASGAIDLEGWQDPSLSGSRSSEAPAFSSGRRPVWRGLPYALHREAGARQRR